MHPLELVEASCRTPQRVRSLISKCRCLTEVNDIPSHDEVVFIAPNKNQIDVAWVESALVESLNSRVHTLGAGVRDGVRTEGH